MTRGERTLAPPHRGLLVTTGLLAASGLVMVYSTTAPLALDRAVPPHFWRHLAGVALGLAVAGVAAAVPTSTWRRLALPLWALGVVLLLVTLGAGERINGARRWLSIPGTGVAFQPGELAKWATLLATAALLAGREAGARRRASGPERTTALVAAVIPAALLFVQPDTGSAALLMALVTLMLFVGGTPLRAFMAPALVGAAAVGGALVLRPYVAERVRAFLDPWARAQDGGFQIVQSFVAFGRGGLLGVDLGDGRQKLFYLPEAHTDFVLSVVAEELGLLGVVLVLATFAAFLFAGCEVALRARSRFALLLAFGMTAFVAVPAGLNAAVVMGAVPATGLTLPFLSYGRTSLLTCFLAVGVLVGISRREGAPQPRAVGRAERRGSWRP